jgi:hypothetical protein
MVKLARTFGLDVIVEEKLANAGELEERGDQRVILIRRGDLATMRFTTAHELAHHLLSTREGVPLSEQTGGRRVEHYCNAFASHLLLPATWLRTQARHREPSLAVAQSIAAAAGCSVSAATTALNREMRWGATLVIWCKRSPRGWEPLTTVHPCRDVRWFFEPASQTNRVLSRLQPEPTDIDLPVVVNGKADSWPGEAVIDGRFALTLHFRST